MTEEQQKVYNICKEVIDKYDKFKHNMIKYAIIDSNNTVWHAFEYFTIVFNHIKNLCVDTNRLPISVVLSLISNTNGIDKIIKYLGNTVDSAASVIYTKEENGANWFEIDIDKCTITKTSLPCSIGESVIDICMLIYVNGAKTIMQSIKYVKDTDMINFLDHMRDQCYNKQYDGFDMNDIIDAIEEKIKPEEENE